MLCIHSWMSDEIATFGYSVEKIIARSSKFSGKIAVSDNTA